MWDIIKIDLALKVDITNCRDKKYYDGKVVEWRSIVFNIKF